MRKTPGGEVIDTRPLYVEEWLDSLPYVDFKKTGQTLYEATLATNQQTIKPAVRMELVQLYNRPYEYYIDSQIKAGAQHTLQSIETMQDQVLVLKKIAANLARACRIAAEDKLKTKTLWRQSKPPLPEFLLSLDYLSHTLIFSYLEYAPVPKNTWSELNFIYDFVESINQASTTVALPKSHSGPQTGTIEHAWKRIALTALSDPYHLPYGAVWEIYEQLGSWADQAMIAQFTPQNSPDGQFVIKLSSDSGPIPYAKFNVNRAADKHRLLDGRTLLDTVKKALATLEKGGKPDASVVLSPYFARLILEHLFHSWGQAKTRREPRKEREGSVELGSGIDTAFYFINQEREFSTADAGDSDESVIDVSAPAEKPDITPQANYRLEQWGLVDQSARGFAVIKDVRPVCKIKVGDLLLVNIAGRNWPRKWAVGGIRWLMIRQGQTYKIGVQIFNTNPQAVAVRARSGSAQDTAFRRGLLLRNPDDKNRASLITSKGLYISGRGLEIKKESSVFTVTADALTESTIGFELFTVETAD